MSSALIDGSFALSNHKDGLFATGGACFGAPAAVCRCRRRGPEVYSKKMGAKKLRGKIIDDKIMVGIANVGWGQNIF
jgi:hypothetical protein